MRLTALVAACASFAVSACNPYACDVESLDAYLAAVMIPAGAADSQFLVARGFAPGGPGFGTIDRRIRDAFTERDGESWSVNVWFFANSNGEHMRIGLRIPTPLRVGMRIELSGVPDTAGLDPVYGLPWNLIKDGETRGRFGLWIDTEMSSESQGILDVIGEDPFRLQVDVRTVLRGREMRLRGTIEFVYMAYTANCS